MDADQRAALDALPTYVYNLTRRLRAGDPSDVDLAAAYHEVLEIRAQANLLKGYLRERLTAAGPLD